ncbi:hypothetical protein Bca4012_037827 [Brassica carinata]
MSSTHQSTNSNQGTKSSIPNSLRHDLMPRTTPLHPDDPLSQTTSSTLKISPARIYSDDLSLKRAPRRTSPRECSTIEFVATTIDKVGTTVDELGTVINELRTTINKLESFFNPQTDSGGLRPGSTTAWVYLPGELNHGVGVLARRAQPQRGSARQRARPSRESARPASST